LEIDGTSIIATTKDSQGSTPEEIEDLMDDYEQFLFDLRYIHIGDEPTLYCPGDDHRPFYRFVKFKLFDSGHPVAYRTVYTKITIITKNDNIPMLAVMAAGGCLVPESDAPELDLFAGVGPDRKKKKRKRHVRNEQEMKGEQLEVLYVDESGIEGDEVRAGFRVMVKFSGDTNTPVVLRPSDLQRVVKLSPSVLEDLPHFGVWPDSKTLHIVFPVVKNGGVKMASEELVVTLSSQAG
jgi:hypothetical protein